MRRRHTTIDKAPRPAPRPGEGPGDRGETPRGQNSGSYSGGRFWRELAGKPVQIHEPPKLGDASACGYEDVRWEERRSCIASKSAQRTYTLPTNGASTIQCQSGGEQLNLALSVHSVPTPLRRRSGFTVNQSDPGSLSAYQQIAYHSFWQRLRSQHPYRHRNIAIRPTCKLQPLFSEVDTHRTS